MCADVYLEDCRLRYGSMRVGFTAEKDPFERYLEQGETYHEWEWKSYWLSAFAQFKYDTFDDGYFPRRGVRLSLKGRYVFQGYSYDLDPVYHTIEEDPVVTDGGKVPHYISSSASVEAAFSIGEHFTVLPKFYAGFFRPFGVDVVMHSAYKYLNTRHAVNLGGFIQDRYVENQIPFFLWPTGFRFTNMITTMAQVDLRYCFARKNYVTLRSGALIRSDDFKDFFSNGCYWAFGAEYARQTVVGPLRVAAQWGRIGGFTVYAGIGFDF